MTCPVCGSNKIVTKNAEVEHESGSFVRNTGDFRLSGWDAIYLTVVCCANCGIIYKPKEKE